MINSERQHTIKIFSIGLAFGVSMFVAQATPAESTLINQEVLVTFNEAGVFTRDAFNVGAGQEITPFDGTNIGKGILFPQEFFDIGEARIVFQIEGLGIDNGTPNHSIPHYQSDAQFSFTNLLWGATPGKIIGVDIILANVFGVDLNSEVFFYQRFFRFKSGDSEYWL